jgi:hypothetical protein
MRWDEAAGRLGQARSMQTGRNREASASLGATSHSASDVAGLIVVGGVRLPFAYDVGTHVPGR